MSLRIVYGLSGSGKSEYCFNKIEDIVNNTKAKVIYMVPEQYSLQAERVVSDRFAKKAMDRVEVLGFERLASKVFSLVGPSLCDYLDDNAKIMLVEKVLLKLKGKLTYFSTGADVFGFASVMADIIKTLKSANVDYNLLIQAANESKSEQVKLKFHDIALILEEYNKFFITPYADSDDDLCALKSKIEKFGLFRDTYIFMDNYDSFSKQQLDVISVLLKSCPRVTLTLTCDSLKYEDDFALFYRSQITADTVIKMAIDGSVEVEPNVYLKGDFDGESELCFLKNNFFAKKREISEKPTKDISICVGKNYLEEVEQIATQIRRLVRKNNYRYKDIAVVTRNPDVYYGLIENVFEKYGILYTITDQTASANNFLHVAMTSVFEILASNYSFESVFGFVRSPFCALSDSDKFLLENYVIESGNTAQLWKVGYETKYKGSFSDYDFERICRAFDYVRDCIDSFAKHFAGRKKASDIVQAYSDFLDYIKAEDVVKKIVLRMRKSGKMRLADETLSVYTHIINSVNQMNLYFGEDNITFEKFYKILKTSIENPSIGNIPTGVDDVLVTSIDRFRGLRAKALFVLGAVEGSIPRGYIGEGLLKDGELKVLGIEETVLRKHSDENYVVYRLFSSACDKLYVSYPIADNEGGAVAPSQIVADIKEIFPNVNIIQNVYQKLNYIDEIEGVVPTFNKVIQHKAEGFWEQALLWFKNNRPDYYAVLCKAKEYDNLPEKLLFENVRALYRTENMKSSISKIEMYNRCAFSYFVRYGLNVRERNVYQLQARDYGTYAHEIVDKYSDFLKENGSANISEELCAKKTAEITKAVLDEALSGYYKESERNRYVYNKMQQMMNTVLWNITQFYNENEYVLLGNEVEFEDGGFFEPIEIELSDKSVVRLTGKVDRVDVRRTDNGDFISIVDYKSSEKNIEFEKILCGVQIQLPVYLKAISEGLSKGERAVMPAAMFYYHIDDPIVDAKKTLSDDKIKQEVLKKLRMKGIIIESEEISGLYTIKKNITSSRIDKLCNTAINKVKTTLDKIVGGDISINPLRFGQSTSCDYCPYWNVCSFDTALNKNEYKNRKKLDMEEFFEYADKMD